MAKGIEDRQPCARRRAPDVHGQGTQYLAKLIKVVRPHLVFGCRTVKGEFGSTTIAAVVQQNAVARPCNRFRYVDQLVVRSATSGRKGDPRTVAADRFIGEPDSADERRSHATATTFLVPIETRSVSHKVRLATCTYFALASGSI